MTEAAPPTLWAGVSVRHAQLILKDVFGSGLTAEERAEYQRLELLAAKENVKETSKTPT